MSFSQSWREREWQRQRLPGIRKRRTFLSSSSRGCPSEPIRLALRGRAAVDPRRGEQPRPGVPRRGRPALLRRARGRRPNLGRGRPVLPRLPGIMGAADPRPRPRGRRRGNQRGGAGGARRARADGLLVRAGSGGATFSPPDSAGVPPSLAALTITLPFNDLAAVRQTFASRGSEIAPVIVEPVA